MAVLHGTHTTVWPWSKTLRWDGGMCLCSETVSAPSGRRSLPWMWTMRTVTVLCASFISLFFTYQPPILETSSGITSYPAPTTEPGVLEVLHEWSDHSHLFSYKPKFITTHISKKIPQKAYHHMYSASPKS